jgi:sarcosine oxidase gamma subunit
MLEARKPLAARAPAIWGALRLRARDDVFAILVTGRDLPELPDAIRRGPTEYLLIGHDPDPLRARALIAVDGKTALVADMSDGFAFVELTGPGAIDLLGIGALLGHGQGAVTTRIADLRVTALHDGEAATVLLIVERSSADYLWQWLEDRLGKASQL